jgi:hypothetical protein
MPPPRPLAPHVQAALQRGAVQPRAVSPVRPLAPHVQAALGRTSPVHAAQLKAAEKAAEPQRSAPLPMAGRDALGYVTYTDQKTPTTPPPPPRWPIYSLQCGEGGCQIQDVRTGRWKEPGTMYAGFVRMGTGGTVYVSPRPDPKVLGDSHPTIAAGTPEGQAGRKALVAAGEVGIVNNQIVGHNDKTGHYRTRKNYWQSGMPPDLFHPFTEDPLSWYQVRPKPGERKRE